MGPASPLIIGEARGKGRPARIPSFIDTALAITLAVSLAVAAVLAGSAYLVSACWPDSSTGALLYATALFVPVLALSSLREYIARSLEMIATAFVPRDIGWALASALLIVFVPAVRSNLTLVLGGMLAAIEIPLWVTLWLHVRNLAPEAPLPRRAYRRWMSRSFAMQANLLAGLGFERMDVLVMGVMSPLAAAGIYGAGARTAPLISTSQRFVVPVITPRVAQAVAQGDFSGCLARGSVGSVCHRRHRHPGRAFDNGLRPADHGGVRSGILGWRSSAAHSRGSPSRDCDRIELFGSRHGRRGAMGFCPYHLARADRDGCGSSACCLWNGLHRSRLDHGNRLVGYNLRVILMVRRKVKARAATAE